MRKVSWNLYKALFTKTALFIQTNLGIISGGGVDAFEVGVCGFSYFGTGEFCAGNGEIGTKIKIFGRLLLKNNSHCIFCSVFVADGDLAGLGCLSRDSDGLWGDKSGILGGTPIGDAGSLGEVGPCCGGIPGDQWCGKTPGLVGLPGIGGWKVADWPACWPGPVAKRGGNPVGVKFWFGGIWGACVGGMGPPRPGNMLWPGTNSDVRGTSTGGNTGDSTRV